MRLSEVVEGTPGQLIKDGYFEKLNFCTSRVEYDFLTFMEKEKFVPKMSKRVSCVICTPEIVNNLPPYVQGVFLSDNPKYDFYVIHNKLSKMVQKEGTRIDPTAMISDGATVSPYNVIIGKNVVIEPNVVINENVIIGNDTIIHSNSVIGGRSFDFAKSKTGEIVGWVDAGKVVIGDRVEICSLAHIAQACLEEDTTLLMDDCKVDSFVHLGHGVHIGKRTAVAAGAIIGGNSIIGDDSWVGINATVSNRIVIGNNARVSLGSVVTKNVADCETVTGNFAIQHKRFIELLKENL